MFKAFDNICLKHILPKKKELRIANVYTTHSSWLNSECLSDLKIDRDNNRINLCEFKFYNTPFSIDSKYLTELRDKINHFKKSKTKKSVYLNMITSYGIKTNAQIMSVVENNLTAECLFKN